MQRCKASEDISKVEQARDEMGNVVNGQILWDSVEVRRCAEYFEQFLNVNERAISIYCFLHNICILMKEAVNEMKSGKAKGQDGAPVGCLKIGCMAVFEYLVRRLNVSFDMGEVPTDWCRSTPAQTQFKM